MAREWKGHLGQVEDLMQEGAAFASTLVGMNLASATASAEQRGFKVQIVPPSGELTFDLDPKRMRLQVNDAGVVTWAHAGLRVDRAAHTYSPPPGETVDSETLA